MKRTVRQLSRYVAVGAGLFAVDLAVFMGLVTIDVPIPVAQLISRATGAVLGFFLHRQWTFAGETEHASGAGTQGAGYAALTLANLGLSPVVVTVLANLVPSLVLAKVLTEVAMVLTTFALTRWLFRRRPE
ncbi:MAG: GtrA family protein [Proteobacteria bacterium]|nr:GtrA family protein [Pseudomonadota bacterium]